MNDALREYLTHLGAPAVLLDRIDIFLSAYQDLLPEPVSAHFVSEYLDEDNQRTFESLWLFSDHFAMEAKLLGSTEDQFDFVPYKNSVRHVVIRKRDFDLREPTSTSRMVVEAWFSDERYGILKATDANCLALVTILRDFLMPNATSGSDL